MSGSVHLSQEDYNRALIVERHQVQAAKAVWVMMGMLSVLAVVSTIIGSMHGGAGLPGMSHQTAETITKVALGGMVLGLVIVVYLNHRAHASAALRAHHDDVQDKNIEIAMLEREIAIRKEAEANLKAKADADQVQTKETIKRLCDELNGKVDVIKENMDRLTAEKQRLEKEIQRLEKMHENGQEAHMETTQDLIEARAQLDESKKEAAAATERAQTAVGLYQTIDADRRHIDADRRQLSERNQALEKQFQEAGELQMKLTEELVATRARIAELEAPRECAPGEVVRCAREVRKKVERLEASNSDLRHQVEDHETLRALQNQRMDVLEQERTSLMAENHQLKEQNADLQAENDALRAELHDKSDELEASFATVEQAQADCAAYAERIQQIQQAMEGLEELQASSED